MAANGQLPLQLKAVPAVLKQGEIERWARKAQLCPLLGVDEAGRGPLAGPVVAAAVSLHGSRRILGLDDSKKLSEARRELLFDKIIARATAFGVGIVDAETIDRIGILPATFLAMRKAIDEALENHFCPALIAVDGNLTIPGVSWPQKAIVKGDGRSRNIAAASILAKVTRDRMMLEYHAEFPQYGFDRHKGYGTKLHLAAIRSEGACSIHRLSFKPCSPD